MLARAVANCTTDSSVSTLVSTLGCASNEFEYLWMVNSPFQVLHREVTDNQL